jgi:FkbM family methyltransferase
MGIGAKSPAWKRALYRAFASTYFRRTCRTGDGTFAAFVSPGSMLKVLDFRQPLVDPAHQRFIRNWVKPDAVVWDIGGNLGLFALPAALKASSGQVYVVEPDVELAANLCRSLRLRQNKKLNVSVLCLAVSDSTGVASFQVAKFSRAMNKLEAAGRWHDDSVIADEVRPVAVMTVDVLAKTLRPPTAIKIDVEGAEMAVLEGAAATISAFRPAILVEGHRALWEAMTAFFARHRYVMLDGESDRPSPVLRPAWNTVAVPQEAFAS